MRYYTKEIRSPDPARFEGLESSLWETMRTERESIHWPGWVYNVLLVASLVFAISTLPFWPWR